jgi:hypothetical protein
MATLLKADTEYTHSLEAAEICISHIQTPAFVMLTALSFVEFIVKIYRNVLLTWTSFVVEYAKIKKEQHL